MTTVYEQLDQTLSPLVGNRAYAEMVPRGTKLPTIRYITIGGSINTTLCDDNDVTVLVQIDVAAKTVVERTALMVQIQAALRNATFPARQSAAPVPLWDESLDAFKASLTYTFD